MVIRPLPVGSAVSNVGAGGLWGKDVGDPGYLTGTCKERNRTVTAEIALESRGRGCLLALACGDALGGPLEFMGAGDIKRTHGRVIDFISGGWLSLRPGETTDDTAMALDLARSLVEMGRVEPGDVARRWVAWLETDPKDIGNTTREALIYLRDGTPWDEAGELVDQKAEPYGGALGNGSIMRCAPLALFLHQDPERLVQASLDTARITHANPLCTWSASALNLMLSFLLNGERTDIARRAAELVPQEEVRQTLLGAVGRSVEELKAGGHVLQTLESALWAFGNADGLEDAIVTAANLGGDADTRAAVTGALAGARYGVEAIPLRWLERLEGRDEIAQLADSLIQTAG